MFTQKGLVDQLDKMKAGWIQGLETANYWSRPWEILHNVSRVDNFKINYALACVSAKTYEDSKSIVFHFPVQTFLLVSHFGWSYHSLQIYTAQTPMLPLKHCTKARISMPLSSGGPHSPNDQSFLTLEYHMPEDGSVSTLRRMVEEDLQVIDHNTKILMAEVRNWLDSNLSDVLDVIAKDRLKVYADPIEDMATAIAESMEIIRTRSS